LSSVASLEYSDTNETAITTALNQTLAAASAQPRTVVADVFTAFQTASGPARGHTGNVGLLCIAAEPPHFGGGDLRLGDRDRAFELLEKSYRGHSSGMAFLKEDPFNWEDLRLNRCTTVAMVMGKAPRMVTGKRIPDYGRP